jgi:hypothetical protein
VERDDLRIEYADGAPVLVNHDEVPVVGPVEQSPRRPEG